MHYVLSPYLTETTMAARRTLTLKREALQELSPQDLTAVAGGTTTKLGETLYSCLAYVSCDIVHCLVYGDSIFCLDD